ncbi:MAG: FAD-dependent oxidoreductase [Bacteroidota bacterium]|nr:FAD-dependent oxidoreductase [Bacteroidota bacterium]
MPEKIKRNEFIKFSLFTGAAIYLNACGVGNKKAISENIIAKDTISRDTLLPKSAQSVVAPTFRLYKKGDSQHEILRKGFNKRINKFPVAIAQCTSTEEVSQAIAYGIKNNLAINIKSGGHSFEGFSSNNYGLVINLSLMNRIEWENENIINVEPGCRLSQLYDAILPKNKLLAAGSCGSVGIGGLTLGGGYGLFSRKYGLTCDSLSEITLVDGKGNVVNSKDDPELLWACKGGGNGNFGVVTSMKFSLNNAPDFLQSIRFTIKKINVQRASDVLEKWFSITSTLPASCFSAFVLNKDSLYILLTNCEKQNAEAQKIISQLSALVDATTIGKQQPLSKAVKVFYGIQHPLYFKNASAGLYKDFEDIRGCVEKVLEKVTTLSGMIYQVNTLGGKINDLDLAKQSAYAHRDKNYLSELQTYWEQASQTDKMINAFEEVQQLFFNNGIKSQYRNYPDINFKNWESAYYGENYSRLQKVKSKYDPENIFRYEQSMKA